MIKKPNLIVNLLLICSGASETLIYKCPKFEIIKYASIGATIFFTALLAFVSCFFALSLIFDSLFLIIVGSSLWAAIIFNLDRYIVMSLRPTESVKNNFLVSLPRLIIAVLVAIVISKPIEIKLFDSEINLFLEQERISNYRKIENKYMSELNILDNKKNQINKNYENKIQAGNKFYEDYMCECNGTCGTLIRGRGIECITRKNKYENYMSNLNIEAKKKDSIISFLASKEIEINRLINSEKKLIASSMGFGFFDKVNALRSIDSISSMFIVFIFIMIETAPMFTKLLSSKGPYDILISKSELEFETELLKIRGIHDIQIKRNKVNEKDEEIKLQSKGKEIKNISRQLVYQKYEKMRKKLESLN